MQEKLKIVITGATGFIGQHLLEDLDMDKYAVTIITRNASKSMRVLPANCTVITADLLDVESLKRAFSGQDVLINLAAEVRNMEKIAQTNIEGTNNLLEAISFCKIQSVIHLSSVGVVGKSYSHSLLTVDENTSCTPQNEYERTKYISENLFLASKKKANYKLTVLRPTNVFGEYHPFNALLGMMKHMQSGKTVACEKNAMVNYVYVKDLTALIIQLTDDKKEHGIVNVGNAEQLNTFFKKVAEPLKVNVKPVLLPAVIVKFAQLFGISKFNTVANKVVYTDAKLNAFFQYPYGINEGLKRTTAHYKKLDLLK